MKQTSSIVFPALIFFLTYGDNLPAAHGEQLVNESPAPIARSAAFARSTSDDGIVGTWKLTMEAYDDNNNNKLDDEEQKMGMKNSSPQALRNYQMQFNANGTCKIERRYNGTYKLTKEGDKKLLTVQLEPHEGVNKKQIPASTHRYHIKSITSSELLLLAEVSGVTYTFWLFKRA